MEEIPSAKELFDKMLLENDETTSTEMMIEFAKLHVKQALKAKIKAMESYYDEGGYSLDEMDAFSYNAYPLSNIQ